MKKQCFRCRAFKKVEEFYKDKNAKDGLLGRCKKCEIKRALKERGNNLEINRKQGRESYHRNLEKNLKRQALYRKKSRFDALKYYSKGKFTCNCCGEDDYNFLSIDHIHGGGTKERKEGKGGGHFLYRRLKKEGYPKGFQVLCYNCNVAKGIFKICPHKKKPMTVPELKELFEKLSL